MSIKLDIVSGTPVSWGEWCDRCLLPSRLRIPINILGADGVTNFGPLPWCPSCVTRREEDL